MISVLLRLRHIFTRYTNIKDMLTLLALNQISSAGAGKDDSFTCDLWH